MNTPNLPISPAAPSLPEGDRRRTPEAIARRRELKVVERDEQGRLLPGSVLPNAGRTAGHTVQFLARRYTAEAINCLAGIMRDDKAPSAARATSAQALLERGWGKSPLQVDVNVRQRFDDFLRDVGIAARHEHDHPIVAEADGTDG